MTHMGSNDSLIVREMASRHILVVVWTRSFGNRYHYWVKSQLARNVNFVGIEAFFHQNQSRKHPYLHGSNEHFSSIMLELMWFGYSLADTHPTILHVWRLTQAPACGPWLVSL